MDTVNIHEAKTQLSRLLARAAMGETVIIAKAGHPIAKLTPIDTPPASKARRLGFLKGDFQIPNDFDTMGSDEIAKMFDGDDRSSFCYWIRTPPPSSPTVPGRGC